MTEIVTLSPHDAIPEGRHVIVIRRFQEDAPGGVGTEIVLTGRPDQVTHPRGPDGQPMHLDAAIAAARKVAESEGIPQVYVLDRMGGPREADILRNDGDHSVHMENLQDTDPEDGEQGPDMRDIAHPRPVV